VDIIQKKTLASIVIGASILIGLSPFLADKTLAQTSTSTFNANATATGEGNSTERLGVVTGSKLQFGKIPVGSASTKFVVVNASQETDVSISSDGNISDSLEFKKSLKVQGSEEIPVTFNATESGFYTGSISLKTTRPKGSIGKKWLEIKSSLS